MIKKTLMCSKTQVFLTNQKKDVPGRDYAAIELEMPTDILWQAQEIIKESEFQATNGDDVLKVTELLRKVCKLLAPYAITEKDRLWLYERAET